MRLEGYFPAKNLVLLEAIKTKESSSGAIILATEQSAGYYKVAKVGPMCQATKIGDYIISSLQMGVEIEFEEGKYMQLPETGIDGYYLPSTQELKNPVPVIQSPSSQDEEEFNVIDSENGDNDVGSEMGLRED